LTKRGVKEAYDALDDEFAFLDEVLKARAESGLTQPKSPERVGTTQSSHCQAGNLAAPKHSPSMATLQRYAKALGYRLEVPSSEAAAPNPALNRTRRKSAARRLALRWAYDGN
jgi:transcriptional regulator with XRE-family HTH domain